MLRWYYPGPFAAPFLFSGNGFVKQTAILLLAFFVAAVHAKGLYLTQEQFLKQSFGASQHEGGQLWLGGDRKTTVQSILNRKGVGLRVRYWRSEDKSAWVLHEVGKDLPITIGIVVRGRERPGIQSIRVLEYRESRGGEVRLDSFTRQFAGVTLNNDTGLSMSIDGITGATLSVRSMKRVARLALFLHAELMAEAVVEASASESVEEY